MNQPHVETEIIDYPQAFKDMALRIERNKPEDFCGAFVIVTPDGDKSELLLLNNQKNAAVFWSLLKTTAEIALSEIEMNERQAGQFRR
jgi:hypothetical protein